MDINTINRIVWWIPFKQLRNDIREYLVYKVNIKKDIVNLNDNILNLRKDIDNIKTKYKITDLWFINNYLIKDFLSNDNDLLNKYSKLINGLDNESVEIVSNIVSALSNNNFHFTDNEIRIKEDLQKKHNNRIIKISDKRYIYSNKYILNQNFFEFCNFYYNMDINYIKNVHFLKDKSIIDAGAFIGDTALILSEYTNVKVYSFEPFSLNFKSLVENIKLNNKLNIEAVNMALGDEDKYIEFLAPKVSRGDTSFVIEKDIYSEDKVTIKMTTLDSFVEKNNIKIGLIKADLEGFEQQFLRGVLNTIKQQKPVLMISIYHSYSDFFDIKPMIEKLNLGYKFKVVKPNDFGIIGETKLIAEVY